MKNYQFDIALSFATENQELVDTVYHYLKARGIHVFFAPSPEGQRFLSGMNQREAFYKIFGLQAEYVALFVSEYYVAKSVPMEEASIAIAEHACNSSVIAIYLDEAELPNELLDAKSTNYFKSNNAATIAAHLASKIQDKTTDEQDVQYQESVQCKNGNIMNANNNKAEGTQLFVQNVSGDVKIGR